MIKYYGDLWNASRSTIDQAARAIMAARGVAVQRVLPLGSGLYVTVVLADGRHLPICQDEIRRAVWSA